MSLSSATRAPLIVGYGAAAWLLVWVLTPRVGRPLARSLEEGD